MSEYSLPPRPKPRACEAAQALQRPLAVPAKYVDESPLMRLGEATDYFNLPKEFCVREGAYNSTGGEGLSTGDIFIACLTKQKPFLKLRPAVSSSESDSVTIPAVTRTEFALTPVNEEGNERNAAIGSWEGEFHTVNEFLQARQNQSMPIPAALNVLNHALDHNGQKVPAKTTLFNICMVSQWVMMQKRCGIEGVDHKGVVHRFLESEDPLHFSTKLYDVKCLPMCFTNVLQLPQTARVYLHPNMGQEEDEGVKSLQNLSNVTITEVSHSHQLVVRKLSDDGNHLGPAFTVPVNADLKVVAIKLKDSQLFDEISDPRCIARANSSLSIGSTDRLADTYMNPYSDDPCEATRGDIQAGKKEDHGKETYYNAETFKLKKCHQYDNMQGAVSFVPSSAVTGGSTAAGASDHYVGSTASDDASDVYEYMEDSKLIAPATAHSTKTQQPHYLRKVPQSQVSRPSPPVVPPHSDHSSKPKPKGVTSTDIPLTPPVSTQPQHQSHVSEKPIMPIKITSQPREQELRYHVAAKLGQDWWKVCTYLDLPLHQLDQADAAHPQLEDKAMQALVMWLRGQENPKAPHSWETLVEALRWARRHDLASEVERCIKDGTLAVVVAKYT